MTDREKTLKCFPEDQQKWNLGVFLEFSMWFQEDQHLLRLRTRTHGSTGEDRSDGSSRNFDTISVSWAADVGHRESVLKSDVGLSFTHARNIPVTLSACCLVHQASPASLWPLFNKQLLSTEPTGTCPVNLLLPNKHQSSLDPSQSANEKKSVYEKSQNLATKGSVYEIKGHKLWGNRVTILQE